MDRYTEWKEQQDPWLRSFNAILFDSIVNAKQKNEFEKNNCIARESEDRAFQSEFNENTCQSAEVETND